MHLQHHDRTSTGRSGALLFLRLAVITAVAFALVAASVSAAPTSGDQTSAAASPEAVAAASCTARIQKGTKLVPLYETYYKYAFKKASTKKKKKAKKASVVLTASAAKKKKGGTYHRVVVKRKRQIKVSCARQCARTKVVKKKRRPVYKVVRRKVTLKKGNRIVKRTKKMRWYVWQKCPNLSKSQGPGTPVKVTILPASHAHLDFGAFQRDMPITGDLSGFIPGGFKLSSDNQINLTRASIQMGVTDVFIDDECGGQVSAAIRTNAASNVQLDPTKSSTSTLTAAGQLTATLYTRVLLALDLRNGEMGCNQPYTPTGYQNIPKTWFLKGKMDAKAGGLAKMHLTSAPDPFDVEACLSPGLPTTECNGYAIPLPIIVNLDVYVSIHVGN